MLKKQYSKTKPTCKVTFTLPEEAVKSAKEVKVLGEFNNWNPALGVPMKLTGKEFKAVVELPVGRDYEFRYLADNGVWENDWAADGYVDIPPYSISNSVVSLQKALAAKATNGKATNGKATNGKATNGKATNGKATNGKATNGKAANAKSDTKAKSTATTKTKAKTVAKKGADDLKKIEGIGPKIAQLLNKDGIVTFEDLAKATKTTLKGILEAAGSRYKMHDPTTWPKQAKLAAKGDWDKLKVLQEELVGGKKK